MRTITCFGDQTSGTFLIIHSVSLTKNFVIVNVFNSVASSRVIGNRLCKKRRINNIWNYRSPYLQYHLSNAGHLGWQHMHSFTKWHLWRQNTIPLMYRDHLVGNRYFVPFFVFYKESVMLGARFIHDSWVHILYPVRNALVRVLYLSACFVLLSTFPAMQYQICLFCTFSHLRN